MPKTKALTARKQIRKLPQIPPEPGAELAFTSSLEMLRSAGFYVRHRAAEVKGRYGVQVFIGGLTPVEREDGKTEFVSATATDTGSAA